ncbi:MAG TPA: chromate efflux transporter [Chloroflexota bacterium]|nr:chromate efflux transporter [Chloroflexota bacterium]
MEQQPDEILGTRPAATRGAVAMIFLKLGIIAFGGPAAHVALMRREFVEKHHWIEEDEFLRMFAACSVIPGPSSTELAIYLGYRLAGVSGLVLAGTLFIAPAMLIMVAIAVVYARFGSTRAVTSALYGIRPVVVAIVAWALLDLGRRILTRPPLWVVALGVFGLSLVYVNPILLLGLAGIAAVLAAQASTVGRRKDAGALMVGPILLPVAAVAAHPGRLATIFFTFLKLGAVSYGSGYVLFAFLHADFVAGLHWLTDGQLADAVAIGQATPGPVFTTATFLGYLFAGVPGALLATLGIFLPGFVLVPFLDRIVRLVGSHPGVRAFLDGVNVGALGLIAAVTVALARTAFLDPLTIVLAAAALPVLLWRPLTAPGLIAAGALIGLAAGHG